MGIRGRGCGLFFGKFVEKKYLTLAVILFKQVVGRALQNIAKGLQIFKFYALCLVVNQPVEVLKTQPQLHIKPIFGLSLFF